MTIVLPWVRSYTVIFIQLSKRRRWQVRSTAAECKLCIRSHSVARWSSQYVIQARRASFTMPGEKNNKKEDIIEKSEMVSYSDTVVISRLQCPSAWHSPKDLFLLHLAVTQRRRVVCSPIAGLKKKKKTKFTTYFLCRMCFNGKMIPHPIWTGLRTLYVSSLTSPEVVSVLHNPIGSLIWFHLKWRRDSALQTGIVSHSPESSRTQTPKLEPAAAPSWHPEEKTFGNSDFLLSPASLTLFSFQFRELTQSLTPE